MERHKAVSQAWTVYVSVYVTVTECYQHVCLCYSMLANALRAYVHAVLVSQLLCCGRLIAQATPTGGGNIGGTRFAK